jgi:hypothetical protein
MHMKTILKWVLRKWSMMLWSRFRFKTFGRTYESGNELTGLINDDNSSYVITEQNKPTMWLYFCVYPRVRHDLFPRTFDINELHRHLTHLCSCVSVCYLWTLSAAGII